MQLLVCILLVLVLMVVSEVEAEVEVETVEQLVMEDYMGLWYEVYTYKESGSEVEGYCATEFYRERDEGVISLHKRVLHHAPNGSAHVTNAAMTQTDPEEPGQFEIHYRGSDDTLSYWVLALGPIDSRGVYSYAIISNPSGDSLWVLARNVTEFFSLYDDEVLEKLEQLDYKNETSGPTVTYQGSDCEYEDMTPMMPVSELSVPQYMGLWYEMYTDDFVESAWENNTYCQQKNYALREDGVRISVHNYHAVGAPDGASSTMTGYMTHHDNMPGEFLLHFPELTSQAMHVWVLHLGPLDKNGLYSYAITSDPTGTVMWVLARNVTEFNLLYDADAHAKLEELGFKDGGKTPVASYQGNDCTYENTDPVEVVQHLDLNKYYGSYYEMYTDNFVDATWESGTYCSVFAFSPNDDGTVGFHNAENRGAPNGTAEVVDGYMVISDPMQPAKFDLSIPTVMHRSVPYWVLAVGPLDSDSMYSYVIMGGSTGLTMWVLARNVSEFNMNYDSDVKALLEDMGYIYGDRSLVSTYQGQYCVYETPTSHGDNNDDEMSAGAKAGLGLIVAIAVGMFLLAGVMFVKNRPSLRHRSSASDKVELVSGDTSDA